MNLDRRNFLKPAVFAAAAAWAIGMGLHQFSYDGTSYFYQSKYYVSSATDKTVARNLAKNLCSGEFSKRYDCRSALMRSNQQQVFVVAVKKLSIVFGPSIVLIVGYRYAVRRRWLDAPSLRAERVIPASARAGASGPPSRPPPHCAPVTARHVLSLGAGLRVPAPNPRFRPPPRFEPRMIGRREMARPFTSIDSLNPAP